MRDGLCWRNATVVLPRATVSIRECERTGAVRHAGVMGARWWVHLADTILLHIVIRVSQPCFGAGYCGCIHPTSNLEHSSISCVE